MNTHEGILYNVYRQQLILKSDLFGGMLTLPVVGVPPLSLSQSSKEWMQLATDAGVGGTSDTTTVQMPPKFVMAEMDHFLEFIFNIRPWTDVTPGLDQLCAVLKTCDFFGVESGMQYAIHHLEDHAELGPALRYRLAEEYHIERWAKRVFYELMSASILDISQSDEGYLGWPVYRALHRLTLALFPPDVVHANFCYDRSYCEGCWTRKWLDTEVGSLGTLLKDEVSGSEMHDTLSDMVVPGMTGECCLLTVRSIQDTAANPSLLKKEEEYIEGAVEALIRDW
ncbi:hypothetical protein C8R43DRAFT_943974 [Mycena crocata]|nr:hypothetical protein C8R43DRAFT_943974 [Mycena crocata]